MKPVRVRFVDFWGVFDPENNLLTEGLRRLAPIELTNGDYDILFFGDDGARLHRQLPAGTKVYFAVENRLPNFRQCDFAFTFHFSDDERVCRLPYYVLRSGDPRRLIKQEEQIDAVLAEQRGFCSAVISNANPRRTRRRLDFFRRLQARRPIASGGRALNNIGGPVADKIAFLRQYRFNLAFENDAYPGYTTEKLFDAMAAQTVPIYWGNPRVTEDFNTDSFIDVSRFSSDEAALDHILEVAEDRATYERYLRAPYFHENRPSPYYSVDRLLPFLERILRHRPGRRTVFSFGDVVFDCRKRIGYTVPFLKPRGAGRPEVP